MATPNPINNNPNLEKMPFAQLLKLVDQYTPEEIAQLRKKLDAKDAVEEWSHLSISKPIFNQLVNNDFFERKIDIDQLAKEQGVRACSSLENLLGDFWPEEEIADDFLVSVASIPDKYHAG